MAFTDRQPGPSRVKQEYGFIMSTTVDDLSYTPSAEERSRDAAQFVATGRKSWKTLKGGGEAVWPPLLEAALLEALEKYQPESVGSKSDSILGRFPMRNRFISDYILETTGKRRTPKQVGSRLQQLRDTCKKDRILQLLSHRNIRDTGSGSQSERSVSASVSPSPPPDGRRSVSTNQEHTYVKIVLQDELWPAPTPSIRLINTDTNHPQSIQLSPTCPPSGTVISQDRSSRNILPYLSRSIELPSSCALLPQSTFVVYVEGSPSPVHSEVASLKCISSPMQRSGWLYSFDLVPTFWERLCASRDVTRYTIVQTLRPTPSNEINEADRTISIVYKFRAADSSAQRSTSTQSLNYPLVYPAPTNNQAISMASQTSSAPRGYPHWQPSVQPDNIDAGWTQLMTPRYPNRFDNSLAPQPQANHAVSFGASYPNHRLPPMSKEVTPIGQRSQADVGSYYNTNQGPPSHSYGPEQDSHSQHFRYS